MSHSELSKLAGFFQEMYLYSSLLERKYLLVNNRSERKVDVASQSNSIRLETQDRQQDRTLTEADESSLNKQWFELPYRIGQVGASYGEGWGSILGRGWTNVYCARGAQWELHMRVGVTASQLDQQSLTPLPVAGFGRLQLRVIHLGYIRSTSASNW